MQALPSSVVRCSHSVPAGGGRPFCRRVGPPSSPASQAMHHARALFVASAVLLSGTASILPAQRRAPAVRVSLSADTPEETRARAQLERILVAWDLSPWLFTREARVDARAIPHSHPVLTVNARYLGNDTAQVATFVHEQLHWFFVDHRAATDSAIARLEREFPDAPSEPPEGARDRYSTYLHLMVCLHEYDAVRALFGEDVARRTLQSWRHYRWVYRQVLERPEPIRHTMREFGLDAPDARRPR